MGRVGMDARRAPSPTPRIHHSKYATETPRRDGKPSRCVAVEAGNSLQPDGPARGPAIEPTGPPAHGWDASL
jgi:hypothetical protein